jgi:beta-glucosidase
VVCITRNPASVMQEGCGPLSPGCVVLLVACSTLLGTARKEAPPIGRAYMNYQLPLEVRVHDLVSRLTLKEKISLLGETAPAIPRLNIAQYHYGNEALHGVVRPGRFPMFPESIGLASTWDTTLIHDIATAISDEARGRYNADKGKMESGGEYGGLYNGLLTFWSPTINMARDPRRGRTAET